MATTRADECYPGARANLIFRIPKFVQQPLVIGEGLGPLGRLLRKRGVRGLHAVECAAQHTADTQSFFDSVQSLPGLGFTTPFPDGYFDAILITNADGLADGLASLIRSLLPSLAPNGYLMALFANRNHHRYTRGPAVAREDIEQCLMQAGLAVYAESAIVSPEDSVFETNAEGWLEIGEQRYSAPTQRDREAVLASDFILFAVRPDYNPVVHARDVMQAGRPEAAYELLTMIPEPYMQDPRVVAVVSTDIMMALLGIDVQTGRHNQLNRFAMSQQFFYRAICREPRLHIAYQCQAEFWRRLGDDGMARRLLRSILHVAADEDTHSQLFAIEQSGRPDLAFDEASPNLAVPTRPLRLLYLIHPRAHYGLDVLYDGLARVLGADHVTDFPWKPTLHGRQPDALGNYPCLFNHPGSAMDLEQIEAALRDGVYDAILFGDVEQSTPRDIARRIAGANPRVPVFLVDELDEAIDMRRETVEHLAIPALAGHFKREMLACVDYGPDTWPLPFAYAEDRIPADVSGPRTVDFFWAGHRMAGLRRLYLEYLEARFGRSLDTYVSQAEYARLLLNVRIGINLFGQGFDTVRYWELPAHGCMLLSERLPIRIPEDFRDGQSAVFFSDTKTLGEALGHYLAHLEQAAEIARAGREHLLRHHTASVRAKQAIARIEQVLRDRQRGVQRQGVQP